MIIFESENIYEHSLLETEKFSFLVSIINFLKMKEKTALKKQKNVKVGSGSLISQIFFFWVFKFAVIARRAKDFKELKLVLRKKDTCVFNDDLLDKKWQEEIVLAAKQKR